MKLHCALHAAQEQLIQLREEVAELHRQHSVEAEAVTAVAAVIPAASPKTSEGVDVANRNSTTIFPFLMAMGSFEKTSSLKRKAHVFRESVNILTAIGEIRRT